MNAPPTLGPMLRAARKRLRMSQTAFAQSIGVSPRALLTWERAGIMPLVAQRERLALGFAGLDFDSWRDIVEGLGLSFDAMLAKVPAQAEVAAERAAAAAAPPRTTAIARAALDDALRIHAEMLDVSARRLRVTVASLLVDIERLGLTASATRDLVLGREPAA